MGQRQPGRFAEQVLRDGQDQLIDRQQHGLLPTTNQLLECFQLLDGSTVNTLSIQFFQPGDASPRPKEILDFWVARDQMMHGPAQVAGFRGFPALPVNPFVHLRQPGRIHRFSQHFKDFLQQDGRLAGGLRCIH